MQLSSFLRRTIPSVAAFAVLTAVSPAAGASISEPAETHCVVHVIGQEKSGEYILSDEECFDDFGSAMDAAGLGSSATTPRRAQAQALALLSTLATHYDGAGYTGSSFTVAGVDCLGGYVNMSVAWDNRVSSTWSTFCPRVRHFTGANLTGSWQDTVSSGNLSSPVNNAVTSIQYLT